MEIHCAKTMWCDAISYMVKHRTMVLPRKQYLGGVRLQTCDEFSVNIKFPSADQNILKRIPCWRLHCGLVLLKLFEKHARFAHV